MEDVAAARGDDEVIHVIIVMVLLVKKNIKVDRTSGGLMAVAKHAASCLVDCECCSVSTLTTCIFHDLAVHRCLSPTPCMWLRVFHR